MFPRINPSQPKSSTISIDSLIDGMIHSNNTYADLIQAKTPPKEKVIHTGTNDTLA